MTRSYVLNKSLMEYMRKEYDNLHSHIEVRETRMRREVRDKAEVHAPEADTMDAFTTSGEKKSQPNIFENHGGDVIVCDDALEYPDSTQATECVRLTPVSERA